MQRRRSKRNDFLLHVLKFVSMTTPMTKGFLCPKLHSADHLVGGAKNGRSRRCRLRVSSLVPELVFSCFFFFHFLISSAHLLEHYRRQLEEKQYCCCCQSWLWSAVTECDGYGFVPSFGFRNTFRDGACLACTTTATTTTAIQDQGSFERLSSDHDS